MSPASCHVAVLALNLALALGFNLAPEFAQVVDGPGRRNDTQFGYTVALQRRKNSADFWMVVGAPKANTTRSNQVTLNQPGVVYRCSVSPSNTRCSELVLDPRPGNSYDGKDPHRGYYEIRDQAWVGASLDVQDDNDGIVVCGPRWINRFYPDFYLCNGICYLKNNVSDLKESAGILMPLIEKGRQGYEKETFYYSYGQAGISSHLVQNGQELLIGAPGVWNWEGTVIRYRYLAQNSIHAAGLKGLSSQDKTDFRINIPRPNSTAETNDFSYFGYAVDSGHFRDRNKIDYVGGAPRGAAMKGSVVLFDFPNKTYDAIIVHIELQGSQLGEYFGAALCVLDVNGDGLDDLLVGAPLHSMNIAGELLRGDEGRVYIFINQKNEVILSPLDVTVMGNSVSGARFGSSIVKLGDINRDGFNDFVVGAPYENEGRGAIYVYHGNSGGVAAAYSQRIAAADIAHHMPIKGFGVSISRGIDIDDNHYNDIAVGAYSSCHAVLIRSRPVIRLRASLANNVQSIAVNASEFVADSCLTFSGEFSPDTVDVRVTLIVFSSNGRAQFAGRGNNMSYTATLNSMVERCEPVSVAILQNNQDITKPITLTMHYEVVDSISSQSTNGVNKGDMFCKSCPVVDPSQSSSIRRLVSFATGCGNSDICRTELSVTSDFVNVTNNGFILGSRATVTIKVTVRNFGEPAYLAKLSVALPFSTPLLRHPSGCHEVGGDLKASLHFECDVANPLIIGTVVEFQLEVGMSELTSLSDLIYNFTVSSDGTEQRSDDNTADLTLTLTSVSDLKIKGFSSQVQTKALESSQTFVQTFEVTNQGPSPADILQLDFRLPVGVVTSNGVIIFVEVYQPSALLDNNQPISCRTLGEHSFTMLTKLESSPGAVNLPTNLKLLSLEYPVVPVPEDIDEPQAITWLPANRTLYVNCSTGSNAVCLEVMCHAGPFQPVTTRAVISFRMQAELNKLDRVRQRRDIIAVSSTGSVSPRTGRPLHARPYHHATATTVLYASMPKEEIDWTWLVTGIAAGLIVLILVVYILCKLGFFRRKKKEELQKIIENETVQNQEGQDFPSAFNENDSPAREL